MSTSCNAIRTTEINVVLIMPSLNIRLTANGMIRRSEHKRREKFEMSGVCMLTIHGDDPLTRVLQPVPVMRDRKHGPAAIPNEIRDYAFLKLTVQR